MLCVVKNISLDGFLLSHLPSVSAKDVLVLSCGAVKCVDMNEELRGNSDIFSRLTALSRDKGITVLLHSDFCAAGGLFNSAAVVDGEICGVSDEINPLTFHSPGGALRCYNTSRGRIGILLGEDIAYPELWARLAICAPAAVFCFAESYRAGLFSSLAALCDCGVCAITPERCGCYSSGGALLKSSFENISRLPLPLGGRQPKILTKTVRTAIEG